MLLKIMEYRTHKKNYSIDDREKARKYYLLGLNLKEVSKLTDIPERTLQKWQQKESWCKYRELGNLKAKALNLKESGLLSKKIGELLNISTTTVWRYCKQ